MLSELNVRDYADWRNQEKPHSLVDVREAWELELARLAGAVHIPMQEIPFEVERLKELPQPLVMLCHAGIRSAQCAAYLSNQGFTEVYNLQGGIHVWAEQIDPDVGFY